MRLQACLNGARPAATPFLPLTPQALAADAVAARAAGADCLHIHPRATDGSESLAAADVDAALRAVRAAVPGMPVGLSTGDWIAPHLGRLEDMAGWLVRPDYVSVNLAEPDAPEVMALMRQMGVGIELGLARAADIEHLFTFPGHAAEGAVRAMIEMDFGAFPAARDEALRMRALLEERLPGLPILLHGFGETAWDFIDMAADWGCMTRIGMEDTLCLPDGRAAGNAALVAEAARRLGR